MQRAALSAPANIVEGYARTTYREKRRFYDIAIASLAELEYYIDFYYKLDLYSENTYHQLIERQSETARVLKGLKKSISTR